MKRKKFGGSRLHLPLTNTRNAVIKQVILEDNLWDVDIFHKMNAQKILLFLAFKLKGRKESLLFDLSPFSDIF